MSRRAPATPPRRGFIVLFGWSNRISDDRTAAPLEAPCPNCRQPTTLVGKTSRQWFTLFFIPLIPISKARRFTQCSRCGTQFGVPIEEIASRMGQQSQGDFQQAIAIYNNLRASPNDSAM